MDSLYSNGPVSKDYVVNPFSKHIRNASQIQLAAPYFTDRAVEHIEHGIQSGKRIELIVGLNPSTRPSALRKIFGRAGVSIRYFTSRFHAKIFIFDNAAMVGSANLTDGGLFSNREATLCMDLDGDVDRVNEVKALFADLWDSALVLTDDVLKEFSSVHNAASAKQAEADDLIERSLGKVEPKTIDVGSLKSTSQRIFSETLRRLVYEQYKPAFTEVTGILAEHGFRRPELSGIGIANETNRFLNWLRLEFVHGDDAWRLAPLRSPSDRRVEIERYGPQWAAAVNNRIPEDYVGWLRTVRQVFGEPEAIRSASKEALTDGLMSLHAFTEQLRFTRGGLANLPPAFWSANEDNVERVRTSLLHLLHGSGDFIERLHDVLYNGKWKLKLFGQFCALELYGTIWPEQCPPMNGRMAKALRYLGFDVPGV